MKKTELTNLLLTKHLLLLSDTIKQFCIKVVDFKKIDYLENDINKFPNKDFTNDQKLIDEYNEIRSTIYNINYYTKNKQYNSFYKNDRIILKNYQTKKYFSTNQDIQDKILIALGKFSVLKYNDIIFAKRRKDYDCVLPRRI